ncbi:MAG: hypothetical protein AAGN46_09175, partial [Acidobacteriota bacterium]
GFFGGDRTFYDDVVMLGPARRLRVRAAGPSDLAVEDLGRWGSWTHAIDRRRTFDDTVDAFAERFEPIVQELTADAPALPLSGGLDARSTLAALPPGHASWSFSYGWGARSIETRLARRMAAVRGLRFTAFDIGPYLLDDLDLALDAVEGFQDLTQTRQLGIREVLAARASRVVCAHWGDVWLDDLGAAEASALDEEELTDRALARAHKRGADWLLEHLVARHLGAPPRRRLRSDVAEELRVTGSLEAPDARLRAWKTDGWSHRWTTASLRAHQAAAFPRLPFYSSRLTEFWATVDPEHLIGRRLQRAYLERYAPDLARIPWQRSGLPLGAGRTRRTLAPVGRALAKARRRVRGERVIERNWEVQLFAPGAWQAVEDLLLGRGRRLPELVPTPALRDLLDRFIARPTPSLAYPVTMLLTFAARLERDR